MSAMSNNSGDKDKNDDRRCSQYHKQLIPGFVRVITQNITLRITQLVNIINENDWMRRTNTTFHLDVDKFVINAMSFIKPLIEESTIVQLNSCKRIPQNQNEYKKVARNRLNRNKPKFVGNYIFEPIIFDRLYKFCDDCFGDSSMIVFVALLQDILSPHSVVRFEQTRAQPLIPYNTFVMDNKFRNSCNTLLRHYKLFQKWENGKKNKCIKKKETAKDKWECFTNVCLPQLADMVQSGQYKNRKPNNLSGMNKVSFITINPIIPNDINNDLNNMVEDDIKSINDNISIPPPINIDQYQSVHTATAHMNPNITTNTNTNTDYPQNRIFYNGSTVHNNNMNGFYESQIMHNNCNQNQYMYDNQQMVNYQPLNMPTYCESHQPMPVLLPPNITPNVTPNITPNMPCYNSNNNNNNNSLNFSVAPNHNNNNNYMDCGDMGCATNNDICNDINLNDNDMSDNYYDNLSIYNEYDLQLNSYEMEQDFTMNDIFGSPMDSSIYTNSTEPTYDQF